ncbi:FkbM family methyltransferase [Bremerella sp. T1]|uniref:FkbM family methyltransferase n=1 Tax=Bremerella sp. TYQ1 TaxID=3119568 RepID=UPI001CCEFAE6|nr:FkbM family methyltransferase [Bremerella volcania]UBM35423.1 FkbM family methyltransferase [Bremerella volcania]
MSIRDTIREILGEFLGDRRSGRKPEIWSLGRDECLTRLHFGALLCFSGDNIDVVPGAFREGWIEPSNNLLLQDILKPGDSCVNIGANFGYFTLLAAHLVGGEGEVLSVEANPYIFHYLVKGIYYSGYPNIVRPFNVAIAEEAGKEYEFYFNPHFSGGGSLAGPSLSNGDNQHIVDSVDEALFRNPKHYRGEGGALDFAKAPFVKFDCRSTTIDWLWEHHPTKKEVKLLHMDIEGAESLAIRGAQKFLSENKNIHIIMEFDPSRFAIPEMRKSIEAMYEIFMRERFQIFQIVGADRDHYSKRPTLKPISSLAEMEKLPHGDLYLSRSGSLY